MWWKRDGFIAIRTYLLAVWDPIGVSGTPEAADEYDGYIAELGERLREGAKPARIADYLAFVRVEGMAMPPHRAVDLEVADSLVAWYRRETA